MTSKVRAGPTIDTEGRIAVQADLSLGVGLATSSRSGGTLSFGAGGGSRNRLELGGGFDYHRFDDGLGWRAGLSTYAAPLDARGGFWFQGALLRPFRSWHRYGGGSKWGYEDRGYWSLGLEGRSGLVIDNAAREGRAMTSFAGAFGLAATLELSTFSEW